jgi:Ferric reductase like transmembrane component.
MNIDPKTWWYVTRATGFVAWALLAIAVLWGLFITNKTLTRSTAPAWVLDLHRHLGGLGVVFVAVHVGALPLDGFTHWGWSDLFVPMSTKWHPGAIAFGIVGMYLLVAIEVTSLLGRRFPKKWWRRVHMLSFPLYVVASIHLFAAGTDAGNGVARWMVVTVSTLVVFLAGTRGLAVAKPRETRTNPRVAAARAQALADPATTPVPVPKPAPVAAPETAPKPAPVSAASPIGDLLPSAVPVAVDVAPPQQPRPELESVTARLAAPTLEERVATLRGHTQAAVERAHAQSGRADRVPAAARAAIARTGD